MSQEKADKKSDKVSLVPWQATMQTLVNSTNATLQSHLGGDAVYSVDLIGVKWTQDLNHLWFYLNYPFALKSENDYTRLEMELDLTKLPLVVDNNLHSVMDLPKGELELLPYVVPLMSIVSWWQDGHLLEQIAGKSLEDAVAFLGWTLHVMQVIWDQVVANGQGFANLVDQDVFDQTVFLTNPDEKAVMDDLAQFLSSMNSIVHDEIGSKDFQVTVETTPAFNVDINKDEEFAQHLFDKYMGNMSSMSMTVILMVALSVLTSHGQGLDLSNEDDRRTLIENLSSYYIDMTVWCNPRNIKQLIKVEDNTEDDQP